VRDDIADIIQIAGLLKLAEPLSGRPDQLLDFMESRVDEQSTRSGAWYPDLTRAAIATIRGDRKVALDWLDRAWDKKWRGGWRENLLGDAVFSQLANEPRYQELVTRFETDMQHQREQAYALLGINQ